MSSSRVARLVRTVPRALSSARSGRPNLAMSVMPRAFHASALARCDADAETKPAAEITSPKVQAIYDQVLEMNLLETIELVNALKDKFGYVEVAAVAAAPAAAGGAGDAAAAQEEEVVEKTEFTVRLDKFGASDKIKVIKEVRTITGLGLKQAKDLVESAPDAIIKKDCPKEEAEELVEKLKAIGGECVLE